MSSLIPPKYVQLTFISLHKSDNTDPDLARRACIELLINQVWISQLVIIGVYIDFKVLVMTAFNAVLFWHILNRSLSLLCRMSMQSLITVTLLSLSNLGIRFLQHSLVSKIDYNHLELTINILLGIVRPLINFPNSLSTYNILNWNIKHKKQDI